MTEPPLDPKDEDYSRAVQRRVEWLKRGKKGRSGWRHLAHVGVLAWTFLLPLLGGAALGRLVAHATGHSWLRVTGLGLGLLAGGYAAWWQIRRSLADEDEGTP